MDRRLFPLECLLIIYIASIRSLRPSSWLLAASIALHANDMHMPSISRPIVAARFSIRTVSIHALLLASLAIRTPSLCLRPWHLVPPENKWSTIAMDDRVSFDVAYRRFVALENPSDVRDTNDRAFQDKLQQAMQFLRQCIKQRQLDGVLSENESFFELQNSQLYAFCLEYFLAMLIPKLTFFQESEPLPAAMQQQRQSGTESTNDQERNVLLRIRFLREADVFHTQFLDRAEQMRILTEKKRREQYERMESKKFSLSRDEKIERFKMQRDLEKKLAAVQERKKQLKGEEDDDLEDIEREQLMTFIQLGVIKSMDEQASINQERDMLETMVKMNQSSDKRDLFTDAHRPPPPQQGQGISVTHINPQFEMRRETIRSEVFQPGHRLPTMSLEEYADREVADAMERQKREAEAPQAPRRYEQLLEEGEEDNHGLVDEATYKDRAWDDWKDANPRGIGNKKGSQF